MQNPNRMKSAWRPTKWICKARWILVRIAEQDWKCIRNDPSRVFCSRVARPPVEIVSRRIFSYRPHRIRRATWAPEHDGSNWRTLQSAFKVVGIRIWRRAFSLYRKLSIRCILTITDDQKWRQDVLQRRAFPMTSHDATSDDRSSVLTISDTKYG